MTGFCGLTYPDSEAIESCLLELKDERFCIVAIDGRDGSGKTTLGHYLALRSGRQFLDADLYLKRTRSAVPTHSRDLVRVLNRWKRRDRPILLAGVFIGETLTMFGFSPTLVRVVRVEQSGVPAWSEHYLKYERRFRPKYFVHLPCHGAHAVDQLCIMLQTERTSSADAASPCRWCATQSEIGHRCENPWD